ncbi:MAG: hypothetical protein R3C28_06630 [Pirellulaceae bacterium]
MTDKNAILGTLIDSAIAQVPDEVVRTKLLACLCPQTSQIRTIADDSNMVRKAKLWVFAAVDDSTYIAYSDEGYSDLRWGLVNIASENFGESGAWYATLSELILDSGFFDVQV